MPCASYSIALNKKDGRNPVFGEYIQDLGGYVEIGPVIKRQKRRTPAV